MGIPETQSEGYPRLLYTGEHYMTYAELSTEELIILAVEFVGRGVPIPHDIQAKLGEDIILEIENPGVQHEYKQDTGQMDKSGITAKTNDGTNSN